LDWISEGKDAAGFLQAAWSGYVWRCLRMALTKTPRSLNVSRVRVIQGHDIIAQECLEIADRKAEDYMVLADGREQLDREHVQTIQAAH
jgi:hypothetical protein